MLQFFITHPMSKRGGFWSTKELYDAFRVSHKTALSLNGFGRLVPKHYTKVVKRMDNKLYRGVILK